MEILIKVSQFLLSLSILIILHELGHFVIARLFKTKVEKFYLFFNPWFSLFKIKRGETEYGVGWLPLGGYVKIAGMVDESLDKEQMKKPPQPWEFRSKSPWQRLLIMLAGVFVNLIFAFFIYIIILFSWGKQYLPTENVKYGIMCDSTALAIGLQNGDKIISVDNKKTDDFHKIFIDILLNDAKTIQIERNGKRQEIEIPQELVTSLIKGEGFISVGIPFVVHSFTDNSPGKKAGLQEGDKLVGINHKNIQFFDEFKTKLAEYKNSEVIVTVNRQGKDIDIRVQVPPSGLIGVYNSSFNDFFELKKIEYSFFQAIPAGIIKGYETIADYLKQLKLIFSPKTKAYESLGGFITIGNIFPNVWNWQSFWQITAFLSIILAVLNLLPIPALDGGHVMFVLYEIVTGRKASDKFLEYAQIVGMVILFALIIYANGNDIIRLLK